MRRRWLVALASVVGLGAWALGGGPARAETASAPVTDDAWFTPPPTCALPIGCGPTDSLPPLSRYPAGTLHVGLTAGIEDSRTYLKIDLGAVPAGGTLTGGTLTLPVAPAADGTTSPETSQIAACFVTSNFTPVEGSLAPPPSIDCSSTIDATYVPGPPAVLVVQLAPFASRWAAGETNYGVALVPAGVPAPGTTWHLAFSSRTRAGSDVPAGSAQLTYDPAAIPVEPAPEIVDEPALSDVITDFLPAAPPQSPAAAIVDQSNLPTQLAPVVDIGGPGFAYPVVMAMPLVLLVLGGYLGWALTRPVVAPQR
jgi:hypothetical protein